MRLNTVGDMVRAVVRPDPFDVARPHLWRPMRLDPGGLTGPTPKAARGGCYRRTSRGLYLPVDVDANDPDQRVVEAAAVLPAYGGVTGWAGLRWAGGTWFSGEARQVRVPVVLVTGSDDVRGQAGIDVSHERLDPRDLTEVDGLRTTSSAWSLCFEIRHVATLEDAVVAAEMAAYDDLVSTGEAVAALAGHRPKAGIVQARRALQLMEENSWSPMEPRVRLVWQLLADLPRLLVNQPVFDLAGHHLGTPDLIDVEAGLAVEYNGRLHLQGERPRVDLHRERLFRSSGLATMTVVAGDLADRDRLAWRMRVERETAARSPVSKRLWTIEQPSWWVPTHTVDLRRALPPGARRRLLGYRHVAA